MGQGARFGVRAHAAGGCWREALSGMLTGRQGPGEGCRSTPVGPVSGGLGRQSPDSCRAGQATADEIAQDEPGGAAGQPGVVLDGAAVAQFEAAAAPAGDLGDDPFHVGPVLCLRYRCGNSGSAAQSWRAARRRLSRWCRTILRPVLDFVQRWRSGQPVHSVPKLATRVALIGRVCPAGLVTVPAGSSMV